VRDERGPAPGDRRPSYAPAVAALVLTVTVYSFASALALEGVPDSESAVFLVMAEVVGVGVAGVGVASTGWLLLARVAGLGVLVSAVAVGLTWRRVARFTRSRRPAP
jgi:hypothetical protein